MELLQLMYCYAAQRNKHGEVIARIVVVQYPAQNTAVVYETKGGLSVNASGNCCLPKPVKGWKKIAKLLFKLMSEMQTGWEIVADSNTKAVVE